MKEIFFGLYIIMGITTLFSYTYNQIGRKINLKKLENAKEFISKNEDLQVKYNEIKEILEVGNFIEYLPSVIFLSFVPIVDIFMFFIFLPMVKMQNYLSKEIKSMLFFHSKRY